MNGLVKYYRGRYVSDFLVSLGRRERDGAIGRRVRYRGIGCSETYEARWRRERMEQFI